MHFSQLFVLHACSHLHSLSIVSTQLTFLNGQQEAYYKKRGCTFTDPPPGTTDVEPLDDDLSVSPATYAGGWCGIHVIEYQKNEPGNGPEDNNPQYQLEVCVFDAKKVLLNQYSGAPRGECGDFVALDGQPQPVCTESSSTLIVSCIDMIAILIFNK